MLLVAWSGRLTWPGRAIASRLTPQVGIVGLETIVRLFCLILRPWVCLHILLVGVSTVRLGWHRSTSRTQVRGPGHPAAVRPAQRLSLRVEGEVVQRVVGVLGCVLFYDAVQDFEEFGVFFEGFRGWRGGCRGADCEEGDGWGFRKEGQ